MFRPSQNLIEINDLTVSIDGTQILKSFNLTIEPGRVHALMGVNGSGKSTLAYTLMGHPRYTVERGEILLSGSSIVQLSPDKRAKLGLFIVFQYPYEIPGLSIPVFLRESYQAITGRSCTVAEFTRLLHEKMEILSLDKSFVERSFNEGFSGGEKKRFELLQALLLQPRLLVLDEIDSGLDIDALKLVATTIKRLSEECPNMGIILITHYNRILYHIEPDYVHVISQGTIVHSGGLEVATALEQYGYGCVSSL